MASWTNKCLAVFLLLGFVILAEGLPVWGITENRISPSLRIQQAKCHAVCSEQHGIVKGWTGPDRDSMADAQKDADAHNKKYHDGKGDVGVLCE